MAGRVGTAGRVGIAGRDGTAGRDGERRRRVRVFGAVLSHSAGKVACMETDRLLTCLRQDGARLAAVAEGQLDAPVPGCPGWVVHDVVLHVAEVYQHKILAI